MTKECRRPNYKKRAFVWITVVGLFILGACERRGPESKGSEAAATNKALESSSSSKPAVGEMIKLPGGRFMMGDASEIDAPSHEVTVSAFSIDKYLVTQEQYE